MELTAIPGVGERTASALAELNDPAAAIESEDVATIAQAPGIAPGRAASIVRAAIQARHDDDGDFLGTPRSTELYEDILGLLQANAVTEYGRRRLETFYPSAAPSRIREARAYTERALERTPTTEVQDPLSDVTPLDTDQSLHIRDRCLVTTDPEQYAAATEAIPELPVETIEDRRALADLARGYASVIVLDERFAGLDVPENVTVDPDALEDPIETVPERTLSFFAANRDSIEAACQVHRAADLEPPTDLDGLEAALDRLAHDGTPVGDDTLDRLTNAVDDVDAAVSTAESVATDQLRDVIQERDLTIEGADLLTLAERGASVDSLLERELADEFEAAIEAARAHLVDALQLPDRDRDMAEAIFPADPAVPVQRDEKAVERLRKTLREQRDRRAAQLTTELARDLAANRSAVRSLISQALELDVELAIAAFADTYDCTMPELGGTGIEVTAARSPVLDCAFEAVEPIDYAVDDVVLLSGVNSGGKTSLLDLLAITTLLAHMGLPVPARSARVERFDGLHYYAATQGTLDAGAFEATLRQFATLVDGADGRLLLVDELESITEPGAAATIVSGILESLDDGTSGVFVSHLAAEIREAADEPVRVDGIAAKGVENGNLVVDRTPVTDHLARSTPELIVESLAETSSDAEAAFYRSLLEKFE